MISYRVTPRAAQDLDDIAIYTLQNWGIDQLDTYLRALERRFARLGENPRAGRDREDVHPGYRSYPEGSHVIFYVIGDDTIDIIGIPHKSMDVGPDNF